MLKTNIKLATIKDYKDSKLLAKDICLKHNYCTQTLYNIRKKNNIKLRGSGLRKYYANENYFNKWSHNMAWILGFTTADGCVYIGNSQTLKYCLNKKDICVLDFIKKEISPNSPIKIYGKYCHLAIHNKNIVSSLINLGVIPRKTGQKTLPNIPDRYKSSYLCGLFDGDGSISYYKRKDNYIIPKFRIVSANESFLHDIKSKIGFNFGKLYKEMKYTGNYLYCWTIHKIKEIDIVYQYIYSSTKFFLKRKFNSFLPIIRYYHEK